MTDEKELKYHNDGIKIISVFPKGQWKAAAAALPCLCKHLLAIYSGQLLCGVAAL